MQFCATRAMRHRRCHVQLKQIRNMRYQYTDEPAGYFEIALG